MNSFDMESLVSTKSIGNGPTNMYTPAMVAICITSMVNNMSYAISAPFLPFEAQDKHVSQDWIGPVFSIFGLAGAIASQQAGYLIAKLD